MSSRSLRAPSDSRTIQRPSWLSAKTSSTLMSTCARSSLLSQLLVGDRIGRMVRQMHPKDAGEILDRETRNRQAIFQPLHAALEKLGKMLKDSRAARPLQR